MGGTWGRRKGERATDHSCEVGINLKERRKKSQNTNSGRIDDLVMRTEAKGATTLEMNSGKDQSVCSAK